MYNLVQVSSTEIESGAVTIHWFLASDEELKVSDEEMEYTSDVERVEVIEKIPLDEVGLDEDQSTILTCLLQYDELANGPLFDILSKLLNTVEVRCSRAYQGS